MTPTSLASWRPKPGRSARRGYRWTFEHESKVSCMPGKRITDHQVHKEIEDAAHGVLVLELVLFDRFVVNSSAALVNEMFK